VNSSTRLELGNTFELRGTQRAGEKQRLHDGKSSRCAGEELKLSVPTVTASLKHLAKLGIARETTGRNYGRIYAYDGNLDVLKTSRRKPFYSFRITQ